MTDTSLLLTVGAGCILAAALLAKGVARQRRVFPRIGGAKKMP